MAKIIVILKSGIECTAFNRDYYFGCPFPCSTTDQESSLNRDKWTLTSMQTALLRKYYRSTTQSKTFLFWACANYCATDLILCDVPHVKLKIDFQRSNVPLKYLESFPYCSHPVSPLFSPSQSIVLTQSCLVVHTSYISPFWNASSLSGIYLAFNYHTDHSLSHTAQFKGIIKRFCVCERGEMVCVTIAFNMCVTTSSKPTCVGLGSLVLLW